MASTTVTTCDRCKEPTPTRTRLEVVCGSLRATYEAIDFCPSCAESLRTWIQANRAEDFALESSQSKANSNRVPSGKIGVF